jgi:DNA-directed RNA polymerase subunit RPC12/RpoP
MARHNCPYCDRKMKVPYYVIQATIQCLGCSRHFSVSTEAASPSEVAPSAGPPAGDQGASPPLLPLLTLPHQCQHCGASISAPISRHAATVVCPSCDNKASVYAVLHRCPFCGTLLESPSRRAGTETTCPACAKPIRVPNDVLLAEPPGYSDEFRFGFRCPACLGELVSRKEDVGSYAVCPRCRAPIVVPQAGHYPRGLRPARSPDPLDSLHPTKETACPKCRTRLPVTASVCPLCGAPSAPSPSR